jgi:ribonuclease HII
MTVQHSLPDMSCEHSLAARGFKAVAGLDEAGRGPLAGPVAAAAVILPCSWDNPGVNDSKRLSPARRAELALLLKEKAAAWGVGLASAAEIDALNIHHASLLAMLRALRALAPPGADYALLDGRFLLPGLKIPQQALVKGDQKSCSVAAASIIAKVERDRIMLELDQEYPVYGFKIHKGYPTPGHLAALRLHGPCREHRRSYGPVAELSFAFSPD